MLVGYSRVSTQEQSLDAQTDALQAAGCTRIFEEKASGADRSRPELARAVAACQRGDTFVVHKLDRVARSMSHLLAVVEGLDKRGIGFRSLGDPVDTTTPQGRFTLQILGAVAELERELIRARTLAGLHAAMARGAKPGNPALRTAEGRKALAAIRAARRAEKPAEAPAAPKPTDARITTTAALCRNGIPSLRVLGRQLAEAGLLPPKGGQWQPASVRVVLRRCVASGLVSRQ